jgi:hypothetical protein
MSCLITMSQKELHRLEVVLKIRSRRLKPFVQGAELLGLGRSQAREKLIELHHISVAKEILEADFTGSINPNLGSGRDYQRHQIIGP